VNDCFENWNVQNLLYPTLPAFVSWYIWLERNKTIFESGNPSIQKVVYQSLGVVGRSRKKEKVQIPRTTCYAPSEHKTIGWFDGAAQQNGLQSGVGGVIKINEHSTYKWTLNCGQGTNTRDELLGVWASLTLASQLSITDLVVHGDSKIVIDWLNRKGALQVVTLDCWKDRISDLIKLFRTITFPIFSEKITKRLTCLSKQALQKQPGNIAYNLWEDGHEGPTLFLNLY
jgi:ribonuclease HI